jgi:hypothetical protein
MKLIKLGLLSLLALVIMVWGIALLFPANTIVSRAGNIAGSSDTLLKKFTTNKISAQKWLARDQRDLVVKTSDIAFYNNNLFNEQQAENTHADTLFFQVSRGNEMLLQGGLALYQLIPDSTTVQLFYVFQTPWYKPHIRWKMMMADKALGPSLDSMLNRLRQMQ